MRLRRFVIRGGRGGAVASVVRYVVGYLIARELWSILGPWGSAVLVVGAVAVWGWRSRVRHRHG